MKPLRILVIEDDAAIRRGLLAALASEGYEPLPAADGDEGLALYRRGGCDLVLLDLMMPGRSGYDVCREIRTADALTPVLMLTAKGEEADKVVGLRLGADDYITKPFGLRELLARVAAALRRARARAAAEPAADAPAQYSFGRARVDVRQFKARAGRREFDLTERELRMMALFRAHPHEVLSRDRLLNELWGVSYLGTTRTLDQHMAQLRKKIEDKPSRPRYLLTVHGVGYRFEPDGRGGGAGE
jgi:DNA-binding response OmpR family regulator